MVRPPPGVSSADTSPPIASASPRATARPEAHPVARGRVAVPLEGQEDLLAGLLRHPGPGVDDPHLGAAAEPARRHPHPAGRRLVAQRVLDDVAEHPVEQAGVGDDDAGPPGRGSSRPGRARSTAATAAGTTSPRSTGRGDGDQRPGLQPRHVEQVADERVEPVGGVLDGRLELGLVLRREGHLRRAQAADRGLDAGQRGAQVVRHRREQRGAGRAVAGQRRGLAGGLLERAPLEDGAGVRGEGREQPLPVGRHLDARRARGRARRRRWHGSAPIAGCRGARSALVVRCRDGVGDHLGHDLGRLVGASRAGRRSARCGPEHVDGVLEQHGHLVGRAEQGVGQLGEGGRLPLGRDRRARPAGRWCARRTPPPRRRPRRRPGRSAFSGSEMVSVRTGSRKNQLSSPDDATRARRPPARCRRAGRRAR